MSMKCGYFCAFDTRFLLTCFLSLLPYLPASVLWCHPHSSLTMETANSRPNHHHTRRALLCIRNSARRTYGRNCDQKRSHGLYFATLESIVAPDVVSCAPILNRILERGLIQFRASSTSCNATSEAGRPSHSYYLQAV